MHVSRSTVEETEDVSLHPSMEDLLSRIPASHIDATALGAISDGTDVSWIIPIVGGWARHTTLWRDVVLPMYYGDPLDWLR